MKKKCNVVMIATDKAENAILIFNGRNKFAEYHKQFFTQQYLKSMGTDGCNSFHLYILSDDEITLSSDNNGIFVRSNGNLIDIISNPIFTGKYKYKRIIATTDSSLNLNGKHSPVLISISSIPQSFIDKYVSEYNAGNKIESVMVEYEIDGNLLLEVFEKHQDISPPKDFYNDADKNAWKLKLNLDNAIIVHSIKDSWTRNEVIELCKRVIIAGSYSSTFEFDEWIKSNL